MKLTVFNGGEEVKGLTYSAFEEKVVKHLGGIFDDNMCKISRILLNSDIPDYDFPEPPIEGGVEYYSESAFTRFRTGERKVSPKIRKRFHMRPNCLTNVTTCFDKYLLIDASEKMVSNLTADLIKLVKEDDWASEETKNDFIKSAKNAPLSTFMAELLIDIMENDTPSRAKSKKSDRSGKGTKTLPLSNLPKKNDYFQEQGNVLERIRDGFKSRKKEVLEQTLWGLGGVGKTQTAIAYAHKYRKENNYDLICYLDATSQSALVASITKFFEVSGVVKKDDPDTVVCSEFRRWFEESSVKWLIIFDNVDNADSNYIDSFLPQNGKGHVLTTTRMNQAGNERAIEIELFTESTAVSFLQKRTIKNGKPVSDVENAKILAKKLGYLQLALEQAGAYIAETPDCSDFENYLSMLYEYNLEQFNQNVKVMGDVLSVTITWQISMDKIKMESAQQLLALCAYFAPEAIDLELFVKHCEHLPEPLSKDITHKLERSSILRDLVRYSLVKYENNALSIHNLLQEVVRSSHGNGTYVAHCLYLVLADFVDRDATDKPTSLKQQRIAHYLSIAGHVETIKRDPVSLTLVASLYSQIGRTFITYGSHLKYYSEKYKNFSPILSYQEALSICHLTLVILMKAYSIIEKLKGETSSATASAIMEIGWAYNFMEDYDSALEWYHKSVGILKKTSDKDPLFLSAYLSLAYTYETKGDFEAAKVWYARAAEVGQQEARDKIDIISRLDRKPPQFN